MPAPPIPQYVTDLEALYGSPSQSGFGSAVFYEQLQPDPDLEKVALRYYRHFMGDLWERFGEAAWMTPWKPIYTRNAGAEHDILAALQAIADPTVASLVPLLLDQGEAARSALAATYDPEDVANLRIYTIGDGEAMSGLLIAGYRTSGALTVLVLLLD
jgi:hypothetical protein